ncbi:MAG: hypothetical protein PHN49_01740 [Candidatus Omnitrophica bacterium]|nr:hypothetical protein [Candidatus Omnitrophota bacterium]MDD5670341.1 hypothetical protein [Candidatus Omnitrophota bacterium]
MLRYVIPYRSIEYDGSNGKLRIYLKGDVRKYEYTLPIDQLKKKLPASSQPDFKSEPVIRQQLLLAHQIQQMLDSGRAKDLHQIAEWLGISKTRLEQLTNLLFLCPKIQEDIIYENSALLSNITERTI